MELQEKVLGYIFENLEDTILMTGKKGEILYMNRAGEKLFGCGSGWTGKKLWEIIPVVERNDPLIQLIIDAFEEKRKSFHALMDYEGSSGEVVRLHISVTCLWEESCSLLLVINDVTEIARLNSTFVRYTSPEIANYVLNTEEGRRQGGSRREVTILMSDLRGFSALSATLPSETMIQLLNHYFGQMAEIIERHQGTIIEYLGDGIFVVFGAPAENSRHADAAVACAIEMQNAMAEVNHWNLENGYPEIEMGIGISTGMVTVGNIGSDQKMKYGCVGGPVNLAGRLEAMSTGGQILMTELTRAALTETPRICQVHSVLPKGSETSVQVYETTGLGEKWRQAGKKEEPRWEILPDGVSFSYHLMDGKIAQEAEHTGCLWKIAAMEKEGWMTTDTPLQELQKLVLLLGENAYAKVVAREDTGYRIYFTFRPEGFADWIREQKQAGNRDIP